MTEKLKTETEEKPEDVEQDESEEEKAEYSENYRYLYDFTPKDDDKPKSAAEKRLPWLISDFEGITQSVYEAIMIASKRARQLGREQKREIDAWSASMEMIEGTEDEDAADPGIDHFNHIKPTVQALIELKDNKMKYHYPEEDK